MRIISGTSKGRKLIPPPVKDTRIRPTSDRAREALFNILGPKVHQAKVLDLFAGTGALGLEAFSRGATLVVFIDNSTLSLKLIRKNIRLCRQGSDDNTALHVISHDLAKDVPLRKIKQITSVDFDIIFADPPYSKDFSSSILNNPNNSSLLAPNGILIVEERCNTVLPQTISSFSLFDKRVYGETAFWFYESSRQV